MCANIEVPECYSTWFKEEQWSKRLNVEMKLAEETL